MFLSFFPFLVVNLYIPRFTGNFTLDDVDIIHRFILDLRASYPQCKFIIGGDWNADFFRNRRIPVEERILGVIRALERDDLARFPTTNAPTYGDHALTTIDYFMISQSLAPSNFELGPQFGCQHFPLTINVRLSPCLVVAQGN